MYRESSRRTSEGDYLPDNVGDAVVVVTLVDTDDVGRDISALGRSSDDNLLRSSLDVLPGAWAVNEDSGTLHDIVQRCRYSSVGS
jgi:hypothetical protein